MKNKFINMFSPSKNWKTTLILLMVVFVITFFLTITMGFRFENNGESETFKLLGKYGHSLGYIREIYDNDGVGNSSLFAKATFYSSIADYLLISLLLWFLIVIGFVLNQFRFNGLITKTRRVINASIVLASTLILMILVLNLWISYFQSIQVLNHRKWMAEGAWVDGQTWSYSWQTITQLTLILFGVVLVVAITIYNLFVEVNTVYVSIAQKNAVRSTEQKEDTSESLFSE